MTSVIAGMKSFGIIPTEFIGSVVERGSGAKYNPKLTNLQCLRKQNLGLSTQGKTIVNGGRKKRPFEYNTMLSHYIAEKHTFKSWHCSPVGPHLGTLVPMGTKMSFLVPIFFQSLYVLHFMLKNVSKVSTATILCQPFYSL